VKRWYYYIFIILLCLMVTTDTICKAKLVTNMLSLGDKFQ